jgi:hypothetical protein
VKLALILHLAVVCHLSSDFGSVLRHPTSDFVISPGSISVFSFLAFLMSDFRFLLSKFLLLSFEWPVLSFQYSGIKFE